MGKLGAPSCEVRGYQHGMGSRSRELDPAVEVRTHMHAVQEADKGNLSCEHHFLFPYSDICRKIASCSSSALAIV